MQGGAIRSAICLWAAILNIVLASAQAQNQTLIITEFLADNESTSPLEAWELLDEDGDASDWIELYNPTETPISLSGWFLTDDADDLTQWEFPPQVTLAPEQFLVVFASGKDRMDNTQSLHTNFRLSRAGGYLALTQPDGRSVASSFNYPEQLRNVSYGWTAAGFPEQVLVAAGAETAIWLLTNTIPSRIWTDPSYDDSDWTLGHTGVGFGYDTEVDLNIRVIQNYLSSVYLRIPFELAHPDDLAGLTLRMKYDDGFAAYLNGVPVARANAPTEAELAWDSRATQRHDGNSAQVFEDFVLPTSAMTQLKPGRNILAIQGLNMHARSPNFLVLPELWGHRSDDRTPDQSTPAYLEKPTPRWTNTTGALDFARDVTFSRAHGFCDEAFALTLTSATPNVHIRYTLDGSTPTAERGQLYQTPLWIDSSSVVRAVAYKDQTRPSQVRTQSYLFVRDVILQSPQGQTPGPAWPSGSVNGQIYDYGMDPEIVNHPSWADQIEAALLALPTFSLVTDPKHLFDSREGIYSNAGRDGPDWERRTSVELILPDGSEGFAVDAGLRIRGAFSRSGNNPKHSFRLFFRGDYGTGKLKYPLFGAEGVDRFDKIDLRTSQNYSWAFQGDAQNTMIRDVFSRDVQRDMGQPYTRSRYIHLYLNGHYWGVYQTEERADADFAESYLGGNAADYDVIKNDSSGSRALHATDGTMDAYRRLYNAAVAGFSRDEAYYAVQGLGPEGSPDPEGERLLDPENLMDYMICTYYTGDPDAPVSCWAHFSNNVFAIYNRNNPQGFTWYRHDAEHSLGSSGGLYEDRLLTDPVDRTIGRQWRHFNPAWLHLRLCDNPHYRRVFADRVNRFLSFGGLLTTGPNQARWQTRADQIDLAIIAESARWGDAKRSSPRTKDNWEAQNSYMLGTYFPQRTPIVLEQMRSVDMFPKQALVVFRQHGGAITPGFSLRLSQDNGLPGTIYYTVDGNDPRTATGTVHPLAEIYTEDTVHVTLVAPGSSWRYLDNGSNQGTTWRSPNFSDKSWSVGPAPLGYGDGDEATVVGYGPNPNSKYPTTYFRHAFSVTDPSTITALALKIMRDDGAVIYLNGQEATPRINMPSGSINYLTWASGSGVPVGGADESTYYTYAVDPALLQAGNNVLAVEIHQVSGTSSDISFDLELTGVQSGSTSPPIVLNESTTVKARVFANNAWGALTEARFIVGLDTLVINEFMASNQSVLEDPTQPGSYPDWIELYNGSTDPIDLGGMFLTDDLANRTQWQIPADTVLEANQHILFYADGDDSQSPYHTNFKLSAKGESLALIDTDGVTIIDSIQFEQQLGDTVYGRVSDGDPTWDFLLTPTPGVSN